MTTTQSVQEIHVDTLSLDDGDDWEEARNGTAVLVLPDGSRWVCVYPSGFDLTDSEQQLTIDALCEEHNAIDSRGCGTHYIWVNIDQPDPHRVYCAECDDYIDLLEKFGVKIQDLKELNRLRELESIDLDWHKEATEPGGPSWYMEPGDRNLLNAKEHRVGLILPDGTEWERFDPDGLEEPEFPLVTKGDGPFKHVMFWQADQPDVLTRLRKVYCTDCGFVDLLAHTPQHDDDDEGGCDSDGDED